MATLKDIADALGLSPATVSRALNGFPEVSARTRGRVAVMAREMNYSPNQIAQKLVTGRSGMIGMILRAPDDAATDPGFFEVMTGFSQHLAAHDMDLVFHAVPSGDVTAPYRRLVARNLLDGFILNAPTEGDPRIAFLREMRVPFVVHGRHEDEPDYPYYDIDNARLAADSANLLADLGHRRIALINGEGAYSFARARLGGFAVAMAARGLLVPPRFITHGKPAEGYGYRGALAALADDAPPSAFICANIATAMGVLRAGHDLGLRAPQDISVIAHDDGVRSGQGTEAVPMLTVTRSPLRDACAPLAHAMHARLAGVPASALQTIATADLILRATTGPAKGGLSWT